MKFSIAAIAGFLGVVTAGALPPAFTLVAEGGLTVLTDGQYLYYGGNYTTKEIAIFRSGSGNGTVTFTSEHSTPTGWQNLFIVEDAVLPVTLTRPHSGYLPEGASMNGFGVNAKGYFTHGGLDYFAVDGYGSNPQKTVYWYGDHNSVYRASYLWVKEFRE